VWIYKYRESVWKLVRTQALITAELQGWFIVLASGSSGVDLSRTCYVYPDHCPPVTSDHDSGSAALEYGFPVDSLTNAVSVAVYAIQMFANTTETHRPTVHVGIANTFLLLCCLHRFRKTVLCMHGFFECGSWKHPRSRALRHTDNLWQCFRCLDLSKLIHEPFGCPLIILVLVRIHPEACR